MLRLISCILTETIPDIISEGNNTIGVRMPDSKIALKLLKNLKVPIATTSANISNQKTSICKKDVETSIGKDLYKIYGEDIMSDNSDIPNPIKKRRKNK